jgi:hypothetical protein
MNVDDGKKSRPQKIRQKLISVASQENKSQIATLATDSAIPDLTMGFSVSTNSQRY